MAITTEISVMKKINWNATGVEEVIQNVAFILSTYVMSCPLDREFGWEPNLDGPIERAMAVNNARITEAINIFEPRAQVESIRYDQTVDDAMNGLLRPIVKVVIDLDG